MNKIEIRNNTSAESVASQFAKWSNLDMTFAEGQSTATIELKITNKATEEDNYIDITALADATTKDNARIIVRNNAGGITALLKSGEDATFTITFEVKDDEYKASLNDFSVNFDMQKKVIADFPSYDADSRVVISCDTNAKTASVTGNNIENKYPEDFDIVIPSYVKKDNVICAVTSIGDDAFQGCGKVNGAGNLTSITIPNTVTSIGDSAFEYCGLAMISIPAGVTSIGEGAFVMSSLGSITIPESVTNLGAGAFSDCQSLGSVEILGSVTSIGRDTFAYCWQLRTIIIPNSVTSIESAFIECPLSNVYYTGTQEQWNAIAIDSQNNDALFSANIVFNYTGA